MPKKIPKTRTGSSKPEEKSDVSPPLMSAGQIFWIPYKEDNAGAMGLKDSAYSHPCVILSTVPVRNKYAALIMTSLGDKSLDDRGDLLPDFRQRLLPVSPTAKHPHHGIQLRLKDGCEMKYKSYVNTHQIFRFNFDHLRRFPDGIRVFTEESLQIMIERSGFMQIFGRGIALSMQQLSLSDASPPAAQVSEDMNEVPRNLFPRSRTSEEMRAMNWPLSTEESEEILQKLRDADLCMP